MHDEDKTQVQLIIELDELRRRVAELEKDKGASSNATHDAAGLRVFTERRDIENQIETDRLRAEEYTEELLHELVVHQIELEMQNEELRNAQEQLEQSRTKYSDLYEFAPVGYLTLDEKGLVLEANLTIARQLGIERSRLINYPFSVYIVPADRSVFRSHLNKVLTSKQRQSCHVGLTAKSGGVYYAFLDSVFVQDLSGKKLCRTTATDITERKVYEELLRIQRDVAVRLGSAESFAELLKSLLDTCLEIDSVVGGGIYLVDTETGGFRLVCHEGLSPWFVEQIGYIEPNSSKATFAMRGESGYWSRPITLFNNEDLFAKEGLMSIGAIPVKVDGEVVAVLNLACRSKAEIPTMVQTALETIASQIAEIVSRVQMREELQTQSERLQERTAELSASNTALTAEIAERKRVEKELRKSESFANDVINSLKQHIAVLDGEGTIITVNEAWKRFAIENNSADETLYVGTNYLTVCENALLQEHDTCIKTALSGIRSVINASQDLFSFEYPCHSPDKKRWFSMQVSSLRSSRHGVVVAHNDITERKRAEEMLEYLASIVEASNDAIIGESLDGIVTTWNTGAEKIYGYSAEEIIGRHISVLVPCDRTDEVPSTLERVRRGKSIEHLETLRQRKDGKKITISLTISPIRDTTGQISGASTIARDVTRRKQAEDDLLAAERLFREFAENVDAIFWIATPDLGNMLYINVAYEQIFQRSCKSLMEKAWSWFEFVHLEDRSHVSEVMKTNPEGRWTAEYRIIRPDGSVRWIRDRAFPLMGEKETFLRIGGITEDITKEKQMQQEAEYHRQQIIHADKLSALGEVVAGVAHEINNPNSFIAYNIPLLDQTWKLIEPIILKYAKEHPEWHGSRLSLYELCEDMRGIIHDIRVGSDRINRIVRNLKDFARLEESGHARPVQVNEVVEKTMAIVGTQLRKQAVKISIELAQNLPEIEGHFNKLEQVVANLLMNAAHAVRGSDDERVVVRTRYVERLDAILVTVEDNGAGIREDIMDRIFDPFFTTRRSDGGTGLGLSVSYGLIEEHEGTIGILSKPGVGSRFTVFLPMDRNKRLELKPTILYVDDDPVFLGMLQTYFIRVDQSAEGLRSPENVMAYLDDHPEADIVLTDLMMPNVNGWELLTMVKEKYPLLTVVLYSGDSAALKAKPDQAPEPDYLIEKPFTMELLAAIVSKIRRQRL